MNFPILSTIIFIPLLGAAFIFLSSLLIITYVMMGANEYEDSRRRYAYSFYYLSLGIFLGDYFINK